MLVSPLSRVVSAVCDALCRHVSRLIKFPSTAAEQISSKQHFFEVANFPNVLGAVGGTHVAVKVSDSDQLLSKHIYISRVCTPPKCIISVGLIIIVCSLTVTPDMVHVMRRKCLLINVQVVWNATLSFTNAVAKWPRTHMTPSLYQIQPWESSLRKVTYLMDGY